MRELTPRLMRYCLGWTRDRGLAEDVAQDALVALIQRWRRFGPPDSVDAFAFSIARRKAYRAVVRRRLFEPMIAIFDRHHAGADPEATAVTKSEMERTQRALATLPTRDREALLLVAAGDVKIAEAAAMVGISISALKMRLLRARQRLATLLESEHAE